MPLYRKDKRKEDKFISAHKQLKHSLIQRPSGPSETLSLQKQEQRSQELELIERQENGKVLCGLASISE